MDKPTLDYRTTPPEPSTGANASPLASLALLLGVASGPAGVVLKFCAIILHPSDALLALLLPQIAALLFATTVLIRSIQTSRQPIDRNCAIAGIAAACLWSAIAFLLFHV